MREYPPKSKIVVDIGWGWSTKKRVGCFKSIEKALHIVAIRREHVLRGIMTLRLGDYLGKLAIKG